MSPSLAMGGAERVIALMANHWAQAGRDVTLITLDSAHTDTYKLAPHVHRITLNLMRESGHLAAAVWNNARRVTALRRVIRASQPNAVISFTDRMNVLTLLAGRGLDVPVIIAERTNPARHNIGRAWSRLRRRLYPRCTALVVQTEQVRRQMRPIVGDRPIHVIPNAAFQQSGVQSPESRENSSSRSPHSRLPPPDSRPSTFRIVGMGRLEPEKGFDLLIEAFARIAGKHPQWNVHILGEGSARPQLEQLIRDKELTERVMLRGWIDDPGRLLQRAQLFVLPSRYEGFPNSLLEAMACGLPAVSFDCECGPGEIIRQDVDGLLVPAEDVAALAGAMDRLMSDESQRARLASSAVEVTDRFRWETFFERWEAVLTGSQAISSSGDQAPDNLTS